MRFGCNTDEKVQFGKRSPIVFHCIASQRHERPSRGEQSVGTIMNAEQAKRVGEKIADILNTLGNNPPSTS